MKKILFIVVFVILLITVPKTPKANELVDKSTSTPHKETFEGNKSDYSLWRSLGALLLILGALFAINSYLRKRQNAGFLRKGDKRLFVVERAVISQKHQLVLANVDGEDYLIGVAPENISFLKLTGIRNMDQKEDSVA